MFLILLNEIVLIVFIVLEKIGSKGIILRYLLKCCELNIYVYFIFFKKYEKRFIF